ncbi:MAG: hypothetical protein GXY65_13480 [Rhodococcus sp.]|nr:MULTISPECIES: hypothetical protein [Rhodococcus]NLV80325.1 hypothetical protein [Rhodococcus sp. (in: high G+C Gram-positive bacteria)]
MSQSPASYGPLFLQPTDPKTPEPEQVSQPASTEPLDYTSLFSSRA